MILIVFYLTILYCAGFLAMCFWWRWWLLLPASVVAILVKFSARSEQLFEESHGGPALITNADIEKIVTLGAYSGFLASFLVVLGGMTGLRLVKIISVTISFIVIGVIILAFIV